VLGAAAAGAGVSVLLAVVDLPFAAVAHERAADIGLSTQNWPDWLSDVGKSTAIGAGMAGVGAAIFLALIRRFPRNWWMPGSAAVVAFAALLTFVGPVVLDPVFNKFEKLPEGRLRGEVLELAQRSGVDVGEVYRIDASRRTTGANAYVNGLGSTKRVVLYDNLIDDFTPGEVRSVVAHELGHVKQRDLQRGLLWLALVAPAAVFLIQRGTERLLRDPDDAGRPASLPALALMLSLVTLGVTLASNGMSRRVEARADAFAIDITRDPRSHIDLEKRLSVQNISDPDPPAAWHDLFGTHPTTIERIGYGVTYEREHPR
nr:M48 family metalloprotease [Thermoleophilaceae bacterium]